MKQRDSVSDRRVLYTKMFLRESLLALMKEKPIGRITPTELCRHSGINRKTFYSHYDSTESLLKSIEDELYDEIHQSVEQSLENGVNLTLVTNIFRAIYDNRDLCVILFSDFGDKKFLDRITDLIHDRVILEWSTLELAVTDTQMELLYSLFTGGAISLMEDWAQGALHKSPDELALLISSACRSGLMGL